MVRVAVLGAGVNGLGCAVRLKEKLKNVEVVLISKDFSPNTTGDGSAGFWYPYLCADTSEEKLRKWGTETYRLFHSLWLAGVEGVCAIPASLLERTGLPAPEPSWKDSVFGYHAMDQQHLRYLNDLHSASYTHGICFTSFTAEPALFLPYFAGRFKAAGGKVLQAEVTSLTCELLADFDVVVNCTGLGARTLVPDGKLFPIRGQVARVKAPWAFEIFLDNTNGNYIIPNVNSCVLGGTHQDGDFNTSVDPRDSAFVLHGCRRMMPSLEHAPVLSEWAGLRPGRERVRLEPERADNKLIIHNYGHGGSGVTLFWGCAGEVLDILERSLQQDSDQNHHGKTPSKL